MSNILSKQEFTEGVYLIEKEDDFFLLHYSDEISLGVLSPLKRLLIKVIPEKNTLPIFRTLKVKGEKISYINFEEVYFKKNRNVFQLGHKIGKDFIKSVYITNEYETFFTEAEHKYLNDYLLFLSENLYIGKSIEELREFLFSYSVRFVQENLEMYDKIIERIKGYLIVNREYIIQKESE